MGDSDRDNLAAISANHMNFIKSKFERIGETMIIESLLDTDLYKFTMQQVVYHRFPDVKVEYTFKCRNADLDLRPYIAEIQTELAHLCSLSLSMDEINYLMTLPYLKSGYLESLSRLKLEANSVEIKEEGGFTLHVRGDWYQTILFEVPLLAIINEVYFRRTQPDAPSKNSSGLRNLEAKCELIREADIPDFKIIEFGTRRRYSREWQRSVLAYLIQNVPEYVAGTSNVASARQFGLKRYGTMAHEFLQACQAFTALPDSQKFALDIWMQEYRGQLGIALSDVVGMDAFFRDFDRLFSMAYDGARHDSGDPYAWGEKLISHYNRYGIDPLTKLAVFSDGLDIPRALALSKHFKGRIKTMFGIGTNLTNDFDFPALQIVMKMTRCNGRPVAKLSDSSGKTMCDNPAFLAYLLETFKTPQ